jgi:hypothetical protein
LGEDDLRESATAKAVENFGEIDEAAGNASEIDGENGKTGAAAGTEAGGQAGSGAEKAVGPRAGSAAGARAGAKPELTREQRIAKRRRELFKIFRGIDANRLKVVTSLIERAAFYTVSLEDLEAELNANGWTEVYRNGKDQEGVKRSAAADAHISITKNLTAITKQLLEICPAEVKKSKLGGFLAG